MEYERLGNLTRVARFVLHFIPGAAVRTQGATLSKLLTNPDYLRELEDKPPPLSLYEKYDDGRDLGTKPGPESLVNGSLLPTSLPLSWMLGSEDTNQKKKKKKQDELMEPPDPHNLTEKKKKKRSI